MITNKIINNESIVSGTLTRTFVYGALGYIVSVCNLGNGVILTSSALTGGGKLLRSTDYGRTWSVSSGSPTGSDSFRVTNLDNKIVFMYNVNYSAVAQNLYRSDDGGQTFTNLGDLGLTAGHYYNFTRLDGDNIVCIGRYSGILHSSDNGINWTSYGVPLGSTYVSYISRIGNKSLFGMFDRKTTATSTDYGATWETISSDVGRVITNVIYMDDVEMFGFYSNGDFYTTNNYGITIEKRGSINNGHEIDPVYLGNGVIVTGGYGVDGYIEISYDYGKTWDILIDVSSEATRTYGLTYMENVGLLFSGFNIGTIYLYEFAQKTDESPFQAARSDIQSCAEILGSPRAIYPVIPEPASTITARSIIHTTSVFDYSRFDKSLTTNGTILVPLQRELIPGRVGYLELDGTSNYIYRANDTDFDFGDAATDDAFSVVCCVNPDDVTSRQIIGKWDDNSQREWRLFFDANGYPTIQLYDESDDTWIGRQDQTAFTTGSWQVLVATYDGSGINAGCKLYIDGVQLDDADYDNGVYVAMEAVTANLMVGALKNAAAYSEYYDGKMTWIGIAAKELSPDEVWSLTQRLKGVLGI